MNCLQPVYMWLAVLPAGAALGGVPLPLQAMGLGTGTRVHSVPSPEVSIPPPVVEHPPLKVGFAFLMCTFPWGGSSGFCGGASICWDGYFPKKVRLNINTHYLQIQDYWNTALKLLGKTSQTQIILLPDSTLTVDNYIYLEDNRISYVVLSSKYIYI